MPAIGKLGVSMDIVGLSVHGGERSGEAVEAQRLAESYYEMGERISAITVLTDAAAELSEGRFSAAAMELLQRIVDTERDASPLRAVAETCLEHGERKHLAAAVRLLGMAHEHERADTHTLVLLARAFEKMGLPEKARQVEAVLTEISEEEPTLPFAAERPLSEG